MSRARGTTSVATRWRQFLLTPESYSARSVEITWVGLTLAIGATTLFSTWPQFGTAPDIVNAVGWLVACFSLLGRRSHPVAVAAVTITALAFSTAAASPAVLAMSNLALFRGRRAYVPLSVYTLAAVAVNAAVYPAHAGYLAGLPARALIAVAAIGMGQLARTQRHRVHTEQQQREEQARTAERARIAREMHDVLAHRLSLLSVHAGALEFHPDAPPEEVAQAASVIRASAHAALGELREVIGLLRDPDETPGEPGDLAVGAPQPPQPTLKDLPDLVAESRQAGMDVAFALRLEHPDAVPDGTARAVYRVVQEGLTNARKHAPSSSVEIEVSREGEGQLMVSVLSHPPANGGTPVSGVTQAAAADTEPLPGAGTGLVGLAERVTLAGGGLSHAPTPDGGYALRANLPLPA